MLGNGALLALMLAHFTNDMLGGALILLLPGMKDRFALDNATIGLVALTYAAAGSVSQPFFGYLVDRWGRSWWVPTALAYGGLVAATWGLSSSFPMLLALAALGGLGSGAFHPLGASAAAGVTADRNRNAAMSAYTVGGTTGFAIGPLVMVALLALFGRGGTVALVVPGLVVALLLARHVPNSNARRGARETEVLRPANGPTTVAWGLLARLVAVVMLRSWSFLALFQFVPIWYDDQGYGPAFYGPLATTLILSGAVGTLLGGVVADRHGARQVMLLSVLLAIPPLLLFVGFPGWWAFGTGAVLGLIADSSLGVTLVAAQRLMPGRTGVASGVILGLGFVTGGLGVPVTGLLADLWGLQAALLSLAVPLAAAVLVVLSIPAAVLAAPSRRAIEHHAGGGRPRVAAVENG